MIGHELGKIHGVESVIPYIKIWEQPFFRWLIGELYHNIWEKCSWRSMRHIEKWHSKMFNRKNDPFFFPLTVRQDLRCYELIESKRRTLALIHITEDQYRSITKEQ